MTAAIKKMIVFGKERGHVTVENLNAAMPAGQCSSEMVERILVMLSDSGIDVVEWGGSEDGEAAVVAPRKPLSPLPLQSGAEAPVDSSRDRFDDETSRA